MTVTSDNNNYKNDNSSEKEIDMLGNLSRVHDEPIESIDK